METAMCYPHQQQTPHGAEQAKRLARSSAVHHGFCSTHVSFVMIGQGGIFDPRFPHSHRFLLLDRGEVSRLQNSQDLPKHAASSAVQKPNPPVLGDLRPNPNRVRRKPHVIAGTMMRQLVEKSLIVES
jgi:hypothetical protein